MKASSTKVVILAGGYGTRLAEETDQRPKPMVDVGGHPLLWHIMKIYGACGFRDFVIAAGYKAHVIENYFRSTPLDWNVRVADTGVDTGTGGRLRKLRDLLGRQPFLMTYGDGVANLDIRKVLDFHRGHGRLATITAVRPPARFGRLDLEGDRVTDFVEKPRMGEGWINGGFFVLEPSVLDYIESDSVMFEQEPLARLAREGQLMAYRHDHFWQCVDTLRDLRLLNELWGRAEAPWKTWKG